MTSAEDSETATAVVALLSALAATLGAEGAPARFRDARSERAVPGTERRERPGGTRLPFPNGRVGRRRDRLDLRVIIPGLASLAGDATLAVAVRCEAFGALRAAAATHAAAVAAHWRDARVRAALPALPARRSKSFASAFRSSAAPFRGREDRTAHASARFLSEYLLAAGGGGAAAALSASAGDDARNVVVATETLGTPSGRRGVARPDGTLPARVRVARRGVLSRCGHPSPLSIYPRWSRTRRRSCARRGWAPSGVSRGGAARGLRGAPRGFDRGRPARWPEQDDSANVRAAACRARGRVGVAVRNASRIFVFSEKNTIASRLASDAALLVAAMRDGAKSVRLPASWAVANVCGSAAARARLRREARSSLTYLEEASRRRRDVVVAGRGVRRRGDARGRQGARHARARARTRPRRRRLRSLARRRSSLSSVVHRLSRRGETARHHAGAHVVPRHRQRQDAVERVSRGSGTLRERQSRLNPRCLQQRR